MRQRQSNQCIALTTAQTMTRQVLKMSPRVVEVSQVCSRRQLPSKNRKREGIDASEMNYSPLHQNLKTIFHSHGVLGFWGFGVLETNVGVGKVILGVETVEVSVCDENGLEGGKE